MRWNLIERLTIRTWKTQLRTWFCRAGQHRQRAWNIEHHINSRHVEIFISFYVSRWLTIWTQLLDRNLLIQYFALIINVFSMLLQKRSWSSVTSLSQKIRTSISARHSACHLRLSNFMMMRGITYRNYFFLYVIYLDSVKPVAHRSKKMRYEQFGEGEQNIKSFREI